MFGEHPQFAFCRAIGCSALALWCAAAAPATGANNAAARDLLAQQYGLVEQRGRWVLPLELEMRRELLSLPKYKQELQRAKQAKMETQRLVVEQNAAMGRQIAELQVRIQAGLSAKNLGAVQQQIVNQQISRDRSQVETLQRQWLDPSQLGGYEPLKRQIIRLTNQRNELAITILKIHEQRQMVTEQYEHLGQDRQVRMALETLGGGQRLGPLNDYHSKNFLVQIADYEREVFTSELPLYRADGDLRVSGLIGRTPVTFTWRESSEPTMLTASVIEATGLEVPHDAAKLQHRLADGREVTVREFDVPYMRFGNQLLRSVKAFALPPEAENAGTQIGANAFEGLSPKAEPQNLRLVLN